MVLPQGNLKTFKWKRHFQAHPKWKLLSFYPMEVELFFAHLPKGVYYSFQDVFDDVGNRRLGAEHDFFLKSYPQFCGLLQEPQNRDGTSSSVGSFCCSNAHLSVQVCIGGTDITSGWGLPPLMLMPLDAHAHQWRQGQGLAHWWHQPMHPTPSKPELTGVPWHTYHTVWIGTFSAATSPSQHIQQVAEGGMSCSFWCSGGACPFLGCLFSWAILLAWLGRHLWHCRLSFATGWTIRMQQPDEAFYGSDACQYSTLSLLFLCLVWVLS